jgi:hydrogenase maturation protease
MTQFNLLEERDMPTAETMPQENLLRHGRCDILIACVGNIFLGDDAFGVEVARRLAARQLPDGVRVVDFGIRGLDLAYAILDGCGSVILVDAVARGQPPGTLYVLEPQIDEDGDAQPAAMVDAHGMDPASVLRLVRQLGGPATPMWLVGCEPMPLTDEADLPMELSEPVASAVGDAIKLVEQIVERVLGSREQTKPLPAAKT